MRRLDSRAARAGFFIFAVIVSAVFVQQRLQRRDRDPWAMRLLETSEIEKAPFTAKCDHPVAGHLAFTSRATTPLALAKHLGLVNEPSRLARQQIKYLTGFFHFSEYAGIRVNTLANVDIKVTAHGEAKAGDRLELDEVPDDAHLYPKQFLSRGVDPKTKTLFVDFEATVPVILCERVATPTEVVKFDLPVDPYLAYWYVPKTKRREVAWGAVKAVTNPCSYVQMADLKRPSFYWYVWDPIKKDKDFDCRELIDRKRLVSIEAPFAPNPEASTTYSIVDQLKDVSPLRVSIVFGELGKVGSKEEADESAKKFASISASFGMRENLPGFDPGIQIGNGVLSVLRKLATLDPWRVHKEGSSYVFSSRGRLKESEREVEIEAFVGPTVDYQPGSKHWNFLAGALRRSQFIFYNGHAGMGSTFTLSSLERETGQSLKADELPHYQFIAPLSCFATDYYGEDFLALRGSRGLATDLILPGFEGHSFMMIPAVVQYVDGALAGRKVSLKKSMERFLSIDQPIHLQRR